MMYAHGVVVVVPAFGSAPSVLLPEIFQNRIKDESGTRQVKPTQRRQERVQSPTATVMLQKCRRVPDHWC